MKKIAIILSIIVFGLLLHSQLAHTEIFKWVDEKGTVHFTEDPATIPEKYRDKANSRTTEEDLMTPEQKAKSRKEYEEEVRERLKNEKREYDVKEFEKQVKELEERAKKQREEGKCEIVSFSQFERNLGGGYVSGGHASGHVDEYGWFSGSVSGGVVTGERIDTCVDIVIQNRASEAKTIQKQNIVAYTRKGNRVTPQKGVLIQLAPGLTYRGNICFGQHLSQIVKMELGGL